MATPVIFSAIQCQDLIRELVKLSQIRSMKVNIKKSLQSGLIVGGITTVASIIAGPLGTILGGLSGTLVATYFAGDYKSAAEIIMSDLTDEQRENLANAVLKVLTPQNIMSVAHFVAIMSSNQNDVQNLVSNAVKTFFINDMHMSVLNA